VLGGLHGLICFVRFEWPGDGELFCHRGRLDPNRPKVAGSPFWPFHNMAASLFLHHSHYHLFPTNRGHFPIVFGMGGA